MSRSEKDEALRAKMKIYGVYTDESQLKIGLVDQEARLKELEHAVEKQQKQIHQNVETMRSQQHTIEELCKRLEEQRQVIQKQRHQLKLLHARRDEKKAHAASTPSMPTDRPSTTLLVASMPMLQTSHSGSISVLVRSDSIKEQESESHEFS